MKVFLDTNVLVAAVTTSGLCAKLLDLVITEHTLVVSVIVLEELEEVLSKPRLERPARPRSADFIAFLRQYEGVPRPPAPDPLPVRDPDDAWIVAAALAGGAELLVTGDRDLLEVVGPTPLPIVPPRTALEILTRPPVPKGTR